MLTLCIRKEKVADLKYLDTSVSGNFSIRKEYDEYDVKPPNAMPHGLEDVNI